MGVEVKGKAKGEAPIKSFSINPFVKLRIVNIDMFVSELW